MSFPATNATIELSNPGVFNSDLGADISIYDPVLQEGGYFGWPNPERIFHLAGLGPGQTISITVIKTGTVPTSARRWSMHIVIWDGTGDYNTYIDQSAPVSPVDPDPISWTVPDDVIEAYISVGWQNYEGGGFPDDPDGQLYLFRITIGAGGGTARGSKYGAH